MNAQSYEYKVDDMHFNREREKLPLSLSHLNSAIRYDSYLLLTT